MSLLERIAKVEKPTTREFLRKNLAKYSSDDQLIQSCIEFLGVTPKHIRDILREVREESQINSTVYDSFESISTIPKTVEAHARALGLDLDKWEIYATKENFWGNADDPHYQTKFSRRLKRSWVASEVAKAIKQELSGFDFNFGVKKYPSFPEKNMLELSLIDPHCGDMSYEFPNPLSSLKRFEEAFYELLAVSQIYKISEIIMPLGHDFFNVDNAELSTSSRRHRQDEYPLRYNTYSKAVAVLIRLLREAREIAPVKVFMIPGNHDHETNFFFGHTLRLVFADCPEITIYDGYDAKNDCYRYEPYKFHKFGINLLGFTHGESIARDRLPVLMATESGEKWLNTEHYEWHLGHLHHLTTKNFVTMDEKNGVRLRWLPSMILRSNWSKLKGYAAMAEGIGMVWNDREGNIADFKKRFLGNSRKEK